MKKSTGLVDLDDTTLEKFLDCKLKTDGINKALVHAKALQFTDADCMPMTMEKMRLAQEFLELKDKIMNSCVNTNIIKFNEFWFGILCKKNNKNELIVKPLKEEAIDSIKIDFVSNKVKSKDEYDQFVENNLHQEEHKRYIHKVLRQADEYLKKFFECENTVNKNGNIFYITSHSIKRWEERVNNNNHYKANHNKRISIVDELSQSFAKSVEVYTSISDNIATRFFLNISDMVFFAVSTDNIILTLWRNSFGFSDDAINAQATIMQLEYVKQLSSEFKKMNEDHSAFIAWKKNDLEIVTNNVNELQNQIESLIEKKNEYEAKAEGLKNEINESRKTLKEFNKKLKKEESLIFKQHKSLKDEDDGNKEC